MLSEVVRPQPTILCPLDVPNAGVYEWRMNKIALTDVEIRQMKAPTSGRREIRDTKTTGLWLRVTGSGSKSFVVRGYLDKKPVRVTLGQYPVLSLRDARSQALAIQSQLHQGIGQGLGLAQLGAVAQFEQRRVLAAGVNHGLDVTR